MASNLECIGLRAADEDEFVGLLEHARAAGDEIGRAGDLLVVRWTDPSGARLVVAADGNGQLVELLPSFAGRPGAVLGEIAPFRDEVSRASVFDGAGEQAESFISYGVFVTSADDVSGYARLSGVVLEASRRTVRRTGQVFHVARVRTVGVEIDVCLPGSEHLEPPAPGAVVSGTVFMVGDLHLP